MCPNCNAPVRSDADFCTNCGTQLRPTSAASGNAPSAQPTVARAPDQPPQGAPAPGWPNTARPATPPFKFDLKRLATTDLVVGGASIVVFISLFLPWYGLFGFTVSGMTGHGYLAIALIVAVALVGYLVLRAGLTSFRLPVAHAPLLLVGTGVQLLIVLIAFFQTDGTSHEIGAYLGLLAALVACGAIAVPAINSARGAQGGTS